MATKLRVLALLALVPQPTAEAFAVTGGIGGNTMTASTGGKSRGLCGSSAATVATGRRPAVATRLSAATGFFKSLFGGQKTEKTNKSAETARMSEELFELLSADGGKPDDATVIEMIEKLESAPGVSFNKDYLYDGPWRVLWRKNTEWQRYFDPLNNVADNRAYQWYKEDGSVTNIAQALGDKLYVTVDGQGTPASTSTDLPYEVNVEVSRGWLHGLGGKIPLDFIKGKGTTFVVYNDARLRIFRSDTGGVVVQTKADEVVPV